MAGLVADSKDPAGDRRAEREALTVADLAERFLTEYAAESGPASGSARRSKRTCCRSSAKPRPAL